MPIAVLALLAPVAVAVTTLCHMYNNYLQNVTSYGN